MNDDSFLDRITDESHITWKMINLTNYLLINVLKMKLFSIFSIITVFKRQTN